MDIKRLKDELIYSHLRWDFCLIKGAIFSLQKLKGRGSSALVWIIGAMGPDTVMGKRLTTMLTIFHS